MIIFEFRRVPLSGNKSKILSLNIQHTRFWNTRGIELRNRPYLKTLYDYITISIENCQFFGYWSMFLMQINQFGLANIKIANSSFIFNDYLFNRMTSGVNAISIYISTNKSALQQATTPLVIVLIDNCILTMPISVTFDYRKVEMEAFNYKNGEFSMFARIAIQNTVIKHSIQSCQFSSYFSAEFIPPRKQFWLTSIKNLTELRKPTLILINCTFNIKNCFTDFDIVISRPSFKPKIITLINFQQFYVYISNLSILSGDGIGLLLDESIVYLRGINKIENFKIDLSYYSTFVGIKMTFNSRILLDDSSLLIVDTSYSSEGGILVDPMGYLNPSNHPDDEYYNDYTNCLMYHTECSGLCFYQIVGKGGKLRSEQEIYRSKSSMYIFGYPSKISGFKLYNGHLQNCTMETLTGLTVINQTFHERHIKTTVIDLHFDKLPKYDIKSPPYQICLCNENDKLNKTLWVCNHETNFSVYPGQNLTFLVAVIGDIGAIIKDREIEVINSINPQNKQIVTVDSECKNILTYQPFQNLQISFVTVENSAKDFSIRRKANIRLLEYCPIGLQRKNISNKLTCTCNAVLSLNGFICSISSREDVVLYKQTRANFWLGMFNKNLLFSDQCPLFFCNQQLAESGTTLPKITNGNNDQCVDLHRGFLCSECPQGYSSVFRGLQCTKCHGPWYLISLVYAIVGLLLIALLFLFNLTIVQGTINGISLYANIIYLYDDFLQEHTGEPFYSIISILNFGSASGTCFYDGMDEFAKVMLQFVFPIYLFSLVVIIIIGAHKYNFRIFKVNFVAKRAVPVLATLMMLTYTSLTGAIITALRYTNVYTHDSSTPSPRWLYQPTLLYFQGKHLALGVVAVIASLLYLIPFTVVTLFGDLLRRMCIRSLWFSHFLDVFHGAYRWPLGFWFGLRLVIRVTFLVLQIVLPIQAFALLVFLIMFGFFISEIHIVMPFHRRNTYTNTKEVKGCMKSFRKIAKWLAKIENNETLFFSNIIITSVFVYSSTSSLISSIATILSVSAAVIQLGVIIAYHGYMYFPIPKSIKDRWRNFRELQRERKNHALALKEQRQRVQPQEQTEQFPFQHIHVLVAGVPNEDESTDEEETPFSQSATDSEGRAQQKHAELLEPLILQNNVCHT